HVGQSDRSALKVGSSGGRSSKTSTVISTANTPSENVLNRSGVLLPRGITVIPFLPSMFCGTWRRSLSWVSSQRARADLARSSLKEVPDAFCDFAGMRFQGEVSGVEEANNRVRIVALERLGTGRQKEWIVLTPHRQERRPVLAEVFLE